MNRRGFFKAVTAIVAAPVAWKMGASREEMGDEPVVIPPAALKLPAGAYASSITYTPDSTITWLRPYYAMGSGNNTSLFCYTSSAPAQLLQFADGEWRVS